MAHSPNKVLEQQFEFRSTRENDRATDFGGEHIHEWLAGWPWHEGGESPTSSEIYFSSHLHSSDSRSDPPVARDSVETYGANGQTIEKDSEER